MSPLFYKNESSTIVEADTIAPANKLYYDRKLGLIGDLSVCDNL